MSQFHEDTPYEAAKLYDEGWMTNAPGEIYRTSGPTIKIDLPRWCCLRAMHIADNRWQEKMK